MPFTCLSDFLEDLERDGDLIRIEAEIDPCFEAAEVARQICARDGHAILMSRLTGHDMPLTVNVLSTERRIFRAMGVDRVEEIAERIESLLDASQSSGWFDSMKAASGIVPLGKLSPKVVKTAPVQQIVRLGGDVDLLRLPFLHCWPEEPGRAVTAGIFCSRETESTRGIVEPRRLEIIDHCRMAVCWEPHEAGCRIVAGYRSRGRKMPAAMVLGGDPACRLAAMTLLPFGDGVWSFAGLLREKPLDLVACRSVDLEVPADAEIVIEGTIDPEAETVQSGPWCTPSGYYSPPGTALVFNVTAITQRSNPICPATILGPMSDSRQSDKSAANEWVTIVRTMHRAALPLVRRTIPDLVDFDLPTAGWGRNIGFVSIRKTYAGQARRVANAIWGLSFYMFCKLLVLVDEDVDVSDGDSVWSRVSAMMEPCRDVFFCEGPPSTTDPAFCGVPAADGGFAGPANQLLSSRVGIDATRRFAGESGQQAKAAEMSPQITTMVGERWHEYGLGE